MSFWKKIFGGESDKKSAVEQTQKSETLPPQEKKEAHDKEHSGENKKPKNVCEFC